MKRLLVAAGVAAASLAVQPVSAQEAEQGNNTRNVLGRILDAVLGPEEAEEPATESEVEAAAAPSLQTILDDPRREEDRARDVWRHPAQTIEFMQIEPGMTVMDYFPGQVGWYTKILVPYLGPDGKYIAALTTVPSSSEERQEEQRTFPERFEQSAEEYFKDHDIDGSTTVGINTDSIPEGMEGTVDRVLVFRMMHNLHRRAIAFRELTRFRSLLKDDGMLGIVQHRARPDAPYSYADGNNGYMRQEDVIKLVEAHGFELVGTSEINANPYDPANHVGGVWQIPPRWASQDEAKKAIGESDRMTLLFKKRQ